VKNVIVLLLTGMCNLAIADAAVWKISSDKTHLYLAGTMHILSEDDYPLPQEFDQAYADSTHLVFETDISGMNSPAAAQAMLKQLRYSDGSTLLDRLSPETTQLLQEYCDDRDIPVSALQLFKPGLLLSFLTVTELSALGIDAPGVDAYFDDKADADGKTESELESIDTQIEFMVQMGNEKPDEFVRYMLEDLSQMGAVMDQLRQAWRSGDLTAINELTVEALSEYPDTYQSLLVDRNDNWMPQIQSMLATAPTEMILVGAAHLAGSDGLLELLKKKGYRVERL